MNRIKERESNLELYRIIVMLLIVAHHYVVNSGLTSATGPIALQPWSTKSVFLMLFGAWGKTGINCFVLITGYFMCESRITLKKFIKLLFEVMFYRIFINAVFWIIHTDTFTLVNLLKVIIPVTSVHNGFVNAYLVFFLTIPFLNILIKNMTEKQHVLLVCLLLFMYTFLASFPLFSVTMNYVSWFVVLYFIASYIRKYPKSIFDNTKLWAVLTVGFVLIAALSVVACAYLSVRFNQLLYYYFVCESNRILPLLIGVSAFLLFKNLKIKHSKFINNVSATCFGVLLIHSNNDAMRTWLWNDVLNTVEMYNSSWLYVHAILSTLAIFVICSLIDMVRIRFIENCL